MSEAIGRARVKDGFGLPGTDRPDADLPGGPLPYLDAFAHLDPELPLLLLPIRIETRYALQEDPPELRIRIYPDQIHIDSDRPGASDGEAVLTKQFWLDWHAAKTGGGRQKAWNEHVSRVGRNRASHLARLLQPREGQKGELLFPTIQGTPEKTPAEPVLLPGRWLAVGYSASGVLFEKWSLPVARGLRTGPDPAATPWRVPASGLTVDTAMAWMFDYDKAVAAGMAITVPLTGDAAGALDEVSTLLVLGIADRYEPLAAAQELDRLLAAHERTDGLAFVPQSTPTNNTYRAVAGAPPIEEPAPAIGRPGPQLELPGRKVVADTTGVGNANRLASALGLTDAGTLAGIAYGTDRERERSRAMVRVAFEAVLGTFIRELLRVGETDGLSVEAQNALRDWCIAHVTGGAPYPCLQVGAQPYGILPVRRSTATDSPATTAEHVQKVVSLLLGEWRRALAQVAQLDPNRSADLEADIATVLATQPHPARYFVRRLDQYSGLNVFQRFVTPQWWYTNTVINPIDLQANPGIQTPYREIAIIYAIVSTDVIINSVEDQIGIWETVQQDLPGQLSGQPQSVIDEGMGFVQAVLGLLYGYTTRQNPLRDLNLPEFAGALGQQNTELVEGALYGSSDEWGTAGLVQEPGAVEGHTAADYLAELRDRFTQRTDALPSSTLDDDFLSSRPLLFQLLDKTLHLVPANATEESATVTALNLLATLDPDLLSWLMRETLGLGAHRLDAWATSLATERLARLRQARPEGIQIGAYGWVTGLKPRDVTAEPAGYVHAPSMAHATTAALLRSGWLHHGTDDALSPVAVNYSSARVRAASWLLDGVRQGQQLGDLLGYRFERALHDRKADVHIRPVRELVLNASGSPDVPPDKPVDGIELLDLFRDKALGNLDPLVTEAILEIEEAFDAANDAALVEAVHQLAAGNHERATAVLGGLTGTHSPPELRAPRIPRGGSSVEHRVLILLDPKAERPARGWTAGIRDAVAPALEAWVEGLLPHAGSVGFTLHPHDGGAPTTKTLADLGLSALDAVYLVGDNPAVTPAALATLAAATRVGATTVEIDPAAPGEAPICLAEFAVAAIELRRAFDSLRVATARDLRPGHETADPELDDSSALEAITALVADFETYATDPAAATRLALLGVTGADPRSLETAATRRLANVLAIEVDPADPRPGLRKRLTALVGGAVPILGVFPVSAQPPIAEADEVDAWLDSVAMVRPNVARLVGAGLLSELLSDRGGLRATATQLPAAAGEGWAATGPIPPGTGGRLSLVTIGSGQAGLTTACGLVVDSWPERIPRAEQDTALALQFDAPSNKPPQAWLIAVTPDGESWNRRLILDTLNETLEWAQLRAVGTEDLLDYGRAIPTVYVPGGIINWPTEA